MSPTMLLIYNYVKSQRTCALNQPESRILLFLLYLFKYPWDSNRTILAIISKHWVGNFDSKIQINHYTKRISYISNTTLKQFRFNYL